MRAVGTLMGEQMIHQRAYPGTLRHQALLKAATAYYADDPRVLALSVFGSLGRGNWDAYSDLDLDVVLADEVEVEPLEELRQLGAVFAGLGERVLLIEPDNADAGDIMLASLIGVSVRYHPLRATSPNIVDSLRVLTGSIDPERIKAAGLANRRRDDIPPAQGVNRFVRLALAADIALQRGEIWNVLPALHGMRELLLEAFMLAHGGTRPYRFFQERAEPELKARFGATVPGYSLGSAQRALHELLDLVEHGGATIGGGRLRLSDGQQEMLDAIRRRQATLQLVE